MPQNKVTHIKRIDWNKLDLSPEVNIAAQMITKDIIDGIGSGKDIDGRPFKRLSPVTVEFKKKKGSLHPEKPLWDKGIMKEVYVRPHATKAKPLADIRVPEKEDRVAIGIKHNTGRDVPKREWYGVGKRVQKKLRKEMKLRLNKKLKIGKAI